MKRIKSKITKSSTSKTAFVLGNGRSRLAIDPYELKQHGTLFGCNAAYRDCPLDYLVAVDGPIIYEIMQAKAHHDIPFYIANNKHIVDEQVNRIDPNLPGMMDSGSLAIILTQELGFRDVYLCGFDYKSSNHMHNNVYADTANYKRSTDPHVLDATEQSWYYRQMILFQRYPNTLFTRINGNDYEPPFTAPNFASIHINTFIDKYRLTKQELPEQTARQLPQKPKPKSQQQPVKDNDYNQPKPQQQPIKDNDYNQPGNPHPIWYRQ